MSNTRRPDPLIFHRSAPMSCPYLPDRVEQQLFTELVGVSAQNTFDRLSEAGFRRSHHIIYRPACTGCDACQPVRIPVADFEMTRSWKRIIKANDDLTARNVGMRVTQQQFDLFRQYILSRHGDGDMAHMSARDYVSLVTASPVDTALFEFKDPSGALVAACLADSTRDGLSAVYSFFDPGAAKRSLGSYMILWLIEEAQRLGLDYVYLGFLIDDSPKMAYKGRFRPLELFGPTGWTRAEPTAG
ncbi:MAG: arginyltransferase [Alphaproteobacteria bacterium]|nr:arginyltransferase [Alphaproteobacteria bacterium]